MTAFVSQQLCHYALSCLSRCQTALALQQLPLLSLDVVQKQAWKTSGSAAAAAAYFSRSYARLPDPRPGNKVFNHAVQQQHQQQQQPSDSKQPYPKRSDGPVQKLYKGKWIIPVRLLVRAKIFQLLGGGSIGVVIGSLTMQEASWLDVMALTGLAGGMVAASYCLWYYSRRYVGEMSLLLPDRQYVRLSVLDFWGNREDNDVPLTAIQTFKGVRPKEVSRVTSQLLFPINVTGDRQYYLNSIHEADILDKQVFFSILKGELNPNAEEPEQAQSSAGQQQHPKQQEMEQQDQQ